MSNYVLDIHTHTVASGHAYGTIREMAESAAEKGLEILGISEHAPGIPGTCDPFYFLNLSVIPKTLYGVKIFHGCEINVKNDGTLSLDQKFIDCLDYAICGIHAPCYEDAGIEKNTDNVISCIKNDKVHFVSHPDDDRTPLNYERLVKAAKENRVALEVNNSSLLKKGNRINCIENYRKMLGLCEKYRVPVYMASDAHDPSGVGNFDLAADLIKELKFDENLILNYDSNMFFKLIGM